MASRTINVSAEAYTRLAQLKKEGESFTDVINRLTGKYRILDLVGLWDDDAGAEIEDHINELKDSMDSSLEARSKRLVD